MKLSEKVVGDLVREAIAGLPPAIKLGVSEWKTIEDRFVNFLIDKAEEASIEDDTEAELRFLVIDLETSEVGRSNHMPANIDWL